MTVSPHYRWYATAILELAAAPASWNGSHEPHLDLPPRHNLRIWRADDRAAITLFRQRRTLLDTAGTSAHHDHELSFCAAARSTYTKDGTVYRTPAQTLYGLQAAQNRSRLHACTSNMAPACSAHSRQLPAPPALPPQTLVSCAAGTCFRRDFVVSLHFAYNRAVGTHLSWTYLLKSAPIPPGGPFSTHLPPLSTGHYLQPYNACLRFLRCVRTDISAFLGAPASMPARGI